MRRERSRSGIRLKGLKVYTVGPHVYVYHRASGRRLPPMDDPGFLRAYTEAERAPKTVSRHETFAAVLDLWRKSDTFAALAPSTQQWMWRVAAKLSDKYGHVPTDQIKAKHIEKDLDQMSPVVANNRLKVWRAVLKTAKRNGIVPENEAAAVEKHREGRVAGFIPWSLADIAAYRAKWQIGAPQRTAMEVIYWTGARVVDARTLGSHQIDADGFLLFRQAKTGVTCTMPVLRLPEWMQALSDDHAHLAASIREGTWIVTERDEPRTQKGLSQWLAASARAAGLENRTAHGLRKSRAIALAEAGFTTMQLRAWIGHEDLDSLDVYVRDASKKRVLSNASSNAR